MTDVKTKSWIKSYINLVIDDVKDVDKNVRESVEFRVKMTMKHKTFSEKFPSLLLMVVEQGEDFDHKRLEEMLNLMDGIQNGELEAEEVDKNLGKEYYDKYVAPNIN